MTDEAEFLQGIELDEGSPEPEAIEEPVVEVPEPEPEKHAKPPEGMVPYAAVADERAKRQELQRQLDELRRVDTKPAQDEPEVDFLDDPDKWKEQLTKRHQSELEGIRREMISMRLADSEEMARDRYKDADIKPDEAFTAFGEAVQQNPALAQEMLKAKNPGDFAYNAGRRLLMLANAGGDLETLIKQREEAAVAAALAKLNLSPKAEVPAIPESLSKITGSTGKEPRAPSNVNPEALFANKY